MLIEGSEGIAGAAVLLVRRQLANMASRVGQRVVGSVLGRLVSVVAGGIGLVLIAKDIWDLRHGVLPIIATEMKSKENKEKVREELAKTVAEQINDSLKEIGAETAERVVEIWREFRRAHAKVVDLADRKEEFKRFLESVKATDLPRLDEIVGIVLVRRGGARRHEAPRRTAPCTRPSTACRQPPWTLRGRPARSSRRCSGPPSPATACPRWWSTRCTAAPSREDFTKASLQRLLGMQDRLAITRLASLTPPARTSLFELEIGRAQEPRARAGR